MKKSVLSFLCSALFLLLLCGCASEKAPQTTEQAVITAVLAQDATDYDAVYEYVNNLFPNQYTREDFDLWTPTYMDITGDGNDEVVFTTIYWDGKLEYALILTGDNGEYQVVPSDIYLAKYENDVEYKDGLIVFTQQSGGSGVIWEDMNFFAYNGEEVVFTGLCLPIQDIAAFPEGYAKTGTVEGPFTEFVFTVVNEDYATEETAVIEKGSYRYDPEALSFAYESLMEESAHSDEPNASIRDIADLKNGDEVGGMTIENIDYVVGGDSVSFELIGDAVVIGYIAVDEMYGDYLVMAEDSYTFDESIKIELASVYSYEFTLDYMYITNPEVLSVEQVQELENGNEIYGEISIKEIWHGAKYESEGGTSCEIVELF